MAGGGDRAVAPRARARRLGIRPRQIAPLLGISTRQGLHDRLRLARRKIAQLTGRPDRAVQTDGDQDIRDRVYEWLRVHHSEIREIAAEAVRYRDLTDEAAKWLVEVARDLREHVVTPGALQTLRFALAELGTSQQVVGLEVDRPVRQLLLRWSRLYASYPS